MSWGGSCSTAWPSSLPDCKLYFTSFHDNLSEAQTTTLLSARRLMPDIWLWLVEMDFKTESKDDHIHSTCFFSRSGLTTFTFKEKSAAKKCLPLHFTSSFVPCCVSCFMFSFSFILFSFCCGICLFMWVRMYLFWGNVFTPLCTGCLTLHSGQFNASFRWINSRMHSSHTVWVHGSSRGICLPISA